MEKEIQELALVILFTFNFVCLVILGFCLYAHLKDKKTENKKSEKSNEEKMFDKLFILVSLLPLATISVFSIFGIIKLFI